MATVTGNATKVFNFMAKKYDKYWDLSMEKCEIETFQDDMSFPLITFTDGHISCIYNFSKLCSVLSVYCSLSW